MNAKLLVICGGDQGRPINHVRSRPKQVSGYIDKAPQSSLLNVKWRWGDAARKGQ